MLGTINIVQKSIGNKILHKLIVDITFYSCVYTV